MHGTLLVGDRYRWSFQTIERPLHDAQQVLRVVGTVTPSPRRTMAANGHDSGSVIDVGIRTGGKADGYVM